MLLWLGFLAPALLMAALLLSAERWYLGLVPAAGPDSGEISSGIHLITYSELTPRPKCLFKLVYDVMSKN